jgi:hypothetical protein
VLAARTLIGRRPLASRFVTQPVDEAISILRKHRSTAQGQLDVTGSSWMCADEGGLPMSRKLTSAVAIIMAAVGGGGASADKPFTFRAARFDCREYGEFVYAPTSQRHISPWGN